MKKFFSGSSNLIMSIAELAIGVLLLIDPLKFTSGIIIALGIGLAIIGIFQVFKYFRMDAREASHRGVLTKGLLFISVGAACILKSDWLIKTFAVLTILYGIFIFIAGISKLQTAIDMLRTDRKYWYLALLGALITLGFSVLIIFNPFTTDKILWMVMGIVLIVIAIIDIITFFVAKKRDDDED